MLMGACCQSQWRRRSIQASSPHTYASSARTRAAVPGRRSNSRAYGSVLSITSPVARLRISYLYSAPSRRSGDEQLPHAAGAVHGHRMHAAVPAVEVADHADALGIGRPDREARPGDAAALLDVAAQRAPGLAQAPLVEQIQIMPAQHRRERVGIVQLAHLPALAHAQHIGRRRAAAGRSTRTDRRGARARAGQRRSAGAATPHRPAAGTRADASRRACDAGRAAGRDRAGAPTSRASMRGSGARDGGLMPEGGRCGPQMLVVRAKVAVVRARVAGAGHRTYYRRRARGFPAVPVRRRLTAIGLLRSVQLHNRRPSR